MLNRLTQFLVGAPASAPRPAICYRLATCVLLIEAASADDDFTEDEQKHIVETMKRRFALTDEEAEELLEAAHHAREASSDLWRFTNQINQSFSVAEKINVVEEAWRIFYTDGHLGGEEDHLAHRFGTLLNLNHPQLIEAKLKVLREIRGE
ncbi:MAG: hypothetical protein RLZZ303_95 [Candidatus Hydrogenedentota bacterium]